VSASEGTEQTNEMKKVACRQYGIISVFIQCLKIKSKAPYQGGSHDEVNEWPNCDEKTNTPGETNQQETQMLPTSQR